MKRILLAALAALVLGGCSGEDLKKQLAQKNQLIAAQEGEIKKLKDDMAAREADLKNQCEQRVQKLTAQNKHQVDALNARIASLTKAAEKPQAKTPAKAPAKGKTGSGGR